MPDHYHDPADLRLLKEMGKLAPAEFTAWLNLDKIVGREDGAIPRKYRELIALAVECTTNARIALRSTRKLQREPVRPAKKSSRVRYWRRRCAPEAQPPTAPWL